MPGERQYSLPRTRRWTVLHAVCLGVVLGVLLWILVLASSREWSSGSS